MNIYLLHPRRADCFVLSLLLTLFANLSLQGQTVDDLTPAAGNIVAAMALQPDGKIVIGGPFTNLGGQVRNYIARLNAAGGLDATFNPGANATVYSLALQQDGKVLVGGDFTTLAGRTQRVIGRLNIDGTADTNFASPYASSVSRAQSILVQPDGKIIVGGRTSNGGFVSRLNANGTADSGFTAPSISGQVCATALQPDGKILLGGFFTTIGGQTRLRIARLKANGNLDTEFNPGADDAVFSIAVEASGAILVGGVFETLGGMTRTNLARLDASGRVDATFDPEPSGGTSPVVNSLALQADGKILVGGAFTSLAGVVRNNIGRLNSEGTLDASFTPQANQAVYGVTVQPDGKVVVGGEFYQFGGTFRGRLARWIPAERPVESLACNTSSVLWLRGGNAPEAWRTRFEFSTNGLDWINLGDGMRTSGGWQLTNLALPADAKVRGRAYVAAGGFNNSSWFAEVVSGPPAFLTQPVGRTNNAGTVGVLSVAASGSPPLAFQWQKNGLPVEDAGTISGAHSPLLRFGSLLAANSGSYSVVVSNSFGALTSTVATVKVIDPVVLSGFTTEYRRVGDNFTGGVLAGGTPPLFYQWCKEGVNIAGATDSVLPIDNLQSSDIGLYSITVSNVVGAVTTNRFFLDINVARVDTFLPDVDGTIYGMAEQPDGKILIGGDFTHVGNQYRPALARLDKTGALDPTFDPGTNNSAWVYALALQADGKILVAGSFYLTQGNVTRDNLVRLNPGGTLDAAFDPKANFQVRALALQPDGKIVVGGGIVIGEGPGTLGDQSCSYIGRLNTDGTRDTNFYATANSEVRSLALQPDGKIVVGGTFTALGAVNRSYIGRLNMDGTADQSFVPPAAYPDPPGASGNVNCVALQADGKVVLGGEFTALGRTSRLYLGRLDGDGTLDYSFNPADESRAGHVNSLAVQADGKILVGGRFTGIGGKLRDYLARLLPSGAADPSFGPNAYNARSMSIVSVGASSEGETWVLGNFTSLDGESRTNLARLAATDPVVNQVIFDGATLTWLRTGPLPEIMGATFDTSSAGTNWVSIGSGTRFSAGWRLQGVASVVKTFVRARSSTTGGYYSSSSWPVETVAVIQPRILVDESNFGFHTNCFQFTVLGLKGQSVVIDSTAALPVWSPVCTNLVDDSGKFVFSDCVPGPRRFYRARVEVVPAP